MLLVFDGKLFNNFTLNAFCFTLGFLGNQGFYTGDWNYFQTGCSHSTEEGRAAQEKGQWGPSATKGTEWGTQTRCVRRKKISLFFNILLHYYGKIIWCLNEWICLLSRSGDIFVSQQHREQIRKFEEIGNVENTEKDKNKYTASYICRTPAVGDGRRRSRVGCLMLREMWSRAWLGEVRRQGH